MAINDLLFVNAPVNKDDFLRQFIGHLPPNTQATKDSTIKAWWKVEGGSEFIVYARDFDEDDYIPPTLGMDCNITVCFILNTWERARDNIWYAVSQLLNQTDWEMALRHGDSEIVAVRSRNRTVLNSDCAFWVRDGIFYTPARFGWLTYPILLNLLNLYRWINDGYNMDNCN